MNIKQDNNDGGKNKIFKIARFILIAVLIVAGLFIFFNYLIFWFLPFIIAWFIALMIQPAVNFLHKKIKLPKNLATVLFLLILFITFGIIIFLLFITGMFAKDFSSHKKKLFIISETLFVDSVSEKFPDREESS